MKNLKKGKSLKENNNDHKFIKTEVLNILYCKVGISHFYFGHVSITKPFFYFFSISTKPSSARLRVVLDRFNIPLFNICLPKPNTIKF